VQGVDGDDVTRASLPAPLRRAAALVLLEGAGLLLLGVGYAVSGVVGAPEDRLATVLAGVFAAAAGLGLLPVARGLAAGRGWALSPTVVAQLLLVVVGAGLVQGGVLPVALPLLTVAALVLAGLAAGPSRQVFRGSG